MGEQDKRQPDTRFSTYLKAFGGDWLSRMCGPLSVPFGIVAVWWAHAKILFGCLAVVSLLVASFRVWRNERNNATKELESVLEKNKKELESILEKGTATIEGSQATISILRTEITELKRKPYDEELGKQASVMISKMSDEGRALLRHLPANEPIEIGRRFSNDIAQGAQDTPLGIAYESGIVRHKIERAGSGMIVSQNYVVNSEFRAALKDLLYKR